jgi:hypothetical protein
LGQEKPNHPNDRSFDHCHGFLGDMVDDYNLINDPKEEDDLPIKDCPTFRELSRTLRVQIQRGGAVPWQPPEQVTAPSSILVRGAAVRRFSAAFSVSRSRRGETNNE